MLGPGSFLGKILSDEQQGAKEIGDCLVGHESQTHSAATIRRPKSGGQKSKPPAETVDVNFAVHFPILDRIFGTHYLPKDQWPEGYGISGHPVPKGYVAQFKYPFSK